MIKEVEDLIEVILEKDIEIRELQEEVKQLEEFGTEDTKQMDYLEENISHTLLDNYLYASKDMTFREYLKTINK